MKKFKKWIKFIFIGVFVIVLVIIILTIFFKLKKPKQVVKDEEVSVEVIEVKKENYTQTLPVLGTIKGAIENELRFEIEGILLRYNFREGDRIRKGQIIAVLDTKDAMAKVSYARSRYHSEKAIYEAAKNRLKIYEDLFKSGAISEAKLIEARYETEATEKRMDSAYAELELAISNLEKTNLFAPSDGILAEKKVDAGEFVTPQDIIIKFVSITDAKFETDIPEVNIKDIKIGQKVEVVCDAYPEKIFYGTVNEISPVISEKTRTGTVKVRISNPEGLLRTGMFARGKILTVNMENIVLVPKDSIVQLGTETRLIPIVKIVDDAAKKGIIELRQIITGETISDKIIVLDGLFEGELVVVKTTGPLADGTEVRFNKPETNPEIK